MRGQSAWRTCGCSSGRTAADDGADPWEIPLRRHYRPSAASPARPDCRSGTNPRLRDARCLLEPASIWNTGICKDECLPEETNRRIVDIISDVNLPYSEAARRYLIECGIPKERTYVTGSPMAEVLSMNLDKIKNSDVLKRLGLKKDGYILLSAHREENLDSDKNFNNLFTAINELAKKYDMPILYSCHPRSKKKLEATGFKLDPRVRVNEPLGFNDYNNLQMNALAVVSDSGTLPEESSFYLSINHPIAAVCIRTSTERPEAVEAGDFVIAGITTKELLQATDMAIEMKRNGVLGKPCPDYTDTCVSMKVIRIVQSYTNIVNRMVWRKE